MMKRLAGILLVLWICTGSRGHAEIPLFAAIPWHKLDEKTVIPHPIRSGWVERLIRSGSSGLPADVPSCGGNVYNERIRIEVYKSQFVLVLYAGDRALKVFPVALSGNPIGHKTRVGDKKTPEGRYTGYRHISPGFGSSVYVCYPSRADALRGFLTGLIPYTQFRRIEIAEEHGMIPPADTPLGGKILIHTVDETERTCATCENWTMGCIVMEPRDMRELLSVIPWFTPLEITIFSVDLDLDISIASSLDATTGSGARDSGD